MGLRIGTAGWTIPRQDGAAFPGEGRHLERYGRVLSGVEINSSFHRPHRVATYARWAASVPDGFVFAVKVPREITHKRRLVDVVGPVRQFLAESGGLGDRLGPLLVQLPPSLAFDEGVAAEFFQLLRGEFGGRVVCEPRHPTWFGEDADALMCGCEVARVAADPALLAAAAVPGGWPGLVYHRLHGAPRVYYSSYETGYLDRLAVRLAGVREGWCIFDNTAAGQAMGNALALARLCSRTGGW